MHVTDNVVLQSAFCSMLIYYVVFAIGPNAEDLAERVRFCKYPRVVIENVIEINIHLHYYTSN